MYDGPLRPKMNHMMFLLQQPLAAVRDEDAMRAGSRIRPLPRIPQRVALLGRLRSRRDARSRIRTAHA
jgi:hypothetical protein